MSVKKSIKQASLYPLKRKDRDEDDIQEVEHKKSRDVPKNVAQKAQHVKPGAKFEDKGKPKDDKKGDKAEKQTPKKESAKKEKGA